MYLKHCFGRMAAILLLAFLSMGQPFSLLWGQQAALSDLPQESSQSKSSQNESGRGLSDNKEKHKYWVFFKEKEQFTQDPTLLVSPKTLQNRLALGLPLFQESDLPLTKKQLSIITEEKAEVVCVSKWLNAASAYLSQAQVEKLRQAPEIERVERLDVSLQVVKFPTNDYENAKYGTAMEQLGVQAFQKLGLTGKGVTVGVVDAGFYGAKDSRNLIHLFQSEEQRVLGVRDFVYPQRSNHFNDSQYGSESHGTQVLEMLTGFDSEKKAYYGAATDANFYLARTDDGKGEYRGEEDFWIAAIEWLDSAGVRLVNTSLGYSKGFDDKNEDYAPEQMDGQTAKITKAASIAAQEKGMILIVSAGNEGDDKKWRIISAPADSQHVLSVGATNGSGAKASYSSVGAEFVSYLKPDVSCFSFFGTSFSAPNITGFAACLLQKKPDITYQEMFSVLKESSNLYPYGNNYVGQGVPNAEKALQLLEGLVVETKPSETVSGEEYKFKVKEKDVRVLVFHKKDARFVTEQLYLSRGKGKNYSLKRPSKQVKFSTILIGKMVQEIQWKD